MEILLARHGNTFAPGDPVVWAGSQNDLPLVSEGIAQAERLGRALKLKNRIPVAIYCSPLKRTLHYAQILTELTQCPKKPIIDPRLNEIDYGDWTGLTEVEVISRFGKEPLHSWNQNSYWPSVGSWKSSEAEMKSEVQEFTNEVVSSYDALDTVVVVSSNGRLRYFLSLVEDEFTKRITHGSFKVKTGNICKLTFQPDQKFRLSFWNQDPEVLDKKTD